MRVQWHRASGDWPFVPRHKSTPDNGVFGRALRGEIINETTSLGDLTKSAINRAFVSAGLYPYYDDQGEQHMRVLALITRDNTNQAHHVR